MIDRIKINEEKLDTIISILNELEVSIDKLYSIKNLIIDINDYYGSKNWFKDKKALESDKIKNIKAGILSEDNVWNTLGRIDEYIDILNEIKEDIYK